MHTRFEDTPASLPARRLHHDPFWPTVDLGELRSTLALGDSVSEARLEVALRSAIVQLERTFAGARHLWRRAGYTMLEQVPCGTVEGSSVLLREYRQALLGAVSALLDEQLNVRECPHG
jgi:hypothetical protein